MNSENCHIEDENEYNKLIKIINFRLPHFFKKIGITTSFLILVFLFVYKFYGSNEIIVKDFCRTIMLLFLFVASLSKDLLEDEYVNHVRHQSYVLAFVCAIVYSIGIPLVAFLIDLLFLSNTITGIQFYEISAFEVMFMLICFQLLFFETLKRIGRA